MTYRIVGEDEFWKKLMDVLQAMREARQDSGLPLPSAVVGPGRSGAIASAYASHILHIPFLPYGTPCPPKLRPLLIVDTAYWTGATLRKTERKYNYGETITVYAFREPPMVKFWYEYHPKKGDAMRIKIAA